MKPRESILYAIKRIFRGSWLIFLLMAKAVCFQCTRSCPAVYTMIRHQTEKISSPQESGKNDSIKHGIVNKNRYLMTPIQIDGGLSKVAAVFR
jgi:hypothetical protein